MKRIIASSTLVLVFAAVFVLLLVPQAQAGDDTGCSNASVQGGYGFTGSTNAIVGIGPSAAVASFTADGNGNIVGKITQSFNGLIVRETFTATYTVNPDCTGSATAVLQPSGRTAHVNFVVVDEGNQVFNIQTDPGTIVTFTDKKKSGDACSNTTVKGTYGFTGTGTVLGIGPASSVGLFTAGEDGNITGSQTRSFNGDIAQETFTGTYTVRPDCTGSASFVVQPGGRTAHFDFVVDDEDGNEVRAIQTDPGTVITTIDRRLGDSAE